MPRPAPTSGRLRGALAALVAIAIIGLVGCGDIAPPMNITKDRSSTSSQLAKLLTTARAGADALSQAAANPNTDIRLNDSLDSPLAVLVATVREHGAKAIFSDTGIGRYQVSGMVTIFKSTRIPAESKPTPSDAVVCIKVPAVQPGTPPPVLMTDRSSSASVAAAGRVAVFPGLTGTECTVMVEGPATNVIPNPSAESGLTGWVATQGTATWDSRPPGKTGLSGAHSVHVGVSGPEGSGETPMGPVTAGAVYSASVWVYGPGLELCAGLDYFGGTKAYIASGPCRNTVKLGATWTRLVLPAVTMPKGTSHAAVYVATTRGGGSFWMDAAQIEPGLAVTSFVEGDLGAGYSWSGPPSTSPSLRADGAGVG